MQYNTPIFQRVSVALRNLMLVPESLRSRTIMEDKAIEVLIKVAQVRPPPPPHDATTTRRRWDKQAGCLAKPAHAPPVWWLACCLQYPEDHVQLNAAVALYHVASNKRTQQLAVKKGPSAHHLQSRRRDDVALLTHSLTWLLAVLWLLQASCQR